MPSNILPSQQVFLREGLAQDLQTLTQNQAQRRKSLGWLMGAAALPLMGCGGGGDSALATSPEPIAPIAPTPPLPNTGTNGATSCSAIPSETAGPFPGDGTNNAPGAPTSNVLALAGLQRSDIRSSISGNGSATATGVQLTVNLSLKSVSSACAAPLSGYAVYLWHCDAAGKYSLYDAGVVTESYLRGLQVSDANGNLSFTTVFPGCYAGRWPHIHFEIFNSIANAKRGNAAVKTSQLALPQSVSAAVYSQAGYTSSTNNLNRLSLATDNVFADGSSLQTAAVTGSVAAGYIAHLNVNL